MVNFGKQYGELIMNVALSSAALIETLGSDFLNSRKASKKWSNKQILGHLVDSAYNNHQRIIRTEEQDSMIYRGYDQDYWVDMNQYEFRSAAEILETFIVVQRHFANVVAGMSNEKLTKKYLEHQLDKTAMQDFPVGAQGSLSYLIWDYIFHLEHHMKQIIDGYKVVCPPDFYR